MLSLFEQTVEEQLAALRRQNDLGGWGIPEDVFARLEGAAPEWPEGRDAYRSFRIRFGEGRDGMIRTFEAHCAAIERVHGMYFHRRSKHLLSGAHQYQGDNMERLRLLAGNDTHHAVVEWIIIPDMQQHRVRNSITSVRGSKSLADEGLVLAWLVPNRVFAHQFDECPWYCAGYELSVPEDNNGQWQYVPCVSRIRDCVTVLLTAGRHDTDDFNYSVPSVG